MSSMKSTGSRPSGRQVFGLWPSLRFTKKKQKVSIFYTLRARLFATFLLVAIIPMAILSYFNTRTTENALREAANRALRSAAIQTASTIDDFFQTHLYSVNEKAQSIAIADYLLLDPTARTGTLQEVKARGELVTAFQEEKTLNKMTLGYLLIDSEGRILLDTSQLTISGRTLFAGLNKVDPTAFNLMTAKGLPYVSPVFIDPDQGGNRFYIVSRVSGEDNSLLGIVASYYNADLLQSSLEGNQALAGERSYPILTDDMGIVLANTLSPQTRFRLVTTREENRLRSLISMGRLPDINLNQLSINLPQMAEGLSLYEQQPNFTTTAIGTGNQINAAAVTRLESTSWMVTYLQPQDVFLKPVRAQTRNTLLLAAGIATITGLLAVLVTRRLTNPISRLTEVAERVTAGDLWAQAPASMDEIGQLAGAFNNMTTELRHTLEGLEVRVAERTSELAKASDQMKYRASQLQTVSEVARAVASEQELDNLLNTVTSLISARFSFYHVGIFLVDPTGEFAVLRAANSEGGQRMLARGHKLAVGQVGMVGYATGRGEARIALDVGSDAVYFDNPDLPYTRSEMALPLKVANHVTGALDVQSMEQSAFSKEDIDLLSTLADQVAVAIENVRLFSETRTALAELQGLHRQYLKTEWQEEAKESSRSGYELESGAVKPISLRTGIEKWIDLETQAPVVLDTEGNGKSLVAPISIRGQVVGLLNLGESDVPWTKEDLSLVQAVADQIGVAMENARLLEQTNKRAEREHMVTEITARLRASNDPQVILQTAAQELRKALRASTAHVIIPSKIQPENGGNGKSQTPKEPQEESTPPVDSITEPTDLPQAEAEPSMGETREAELEPESGSILAS